MTDSNNPYETPSSKSDFPELTGQQVSGVLRVTQIITIALSLGLLTFTGISIFSIYQQNAQLNWNFDTLVLMGLGLMAFMVPASFLLPKLVANSMASAQADENPESRLNKLLGQFQSQLIIGLALLEGCGFLNAVAFMQHHHPLSMLAAIFCIGLILVRIPTRSKLQYWLRERLQG
ncbi:MAG: hypothetical protein U0930_10300 [Pirellulales bacterium]